MMQQQRLHQSQRIYFKVDKSVSRSGWHASYQKNIRNLTRDEINKSNPLELVDTLRGTGAVEDKVLDSMKNAMKRMQKAGYSFKHTAVDSDDIMALDETRRKSLSRQSLQGLHVTDIRNPKAKEVWVKDRSLLSEDDVTTTLAHEMLHSVTKTALDYGRKFKKSAQGKAVEELNFFLSHIQKRARAEGIEFASENTLKNIDEFLSYGLTNTDLRNWLQKIPMDDIPHVTYNPFESKPVLTKSQKMKQSITNAWDKFIDIIKKLVGKKDIKPTYYDELIKRGNAIIDGVEYSKTQFKPDDQVRVFNNVFPDVNTIEEANQYPFTVSDIENLKKIQ